MQYDVSLKTPLKPGKPSNSYLPHPKNKFVRVCGHCSSSSLGLDANSSLLKFVSLP